MSNAHRNVSAQSAGPSYKRLPLERPRPAPLPPGSQLTTTPDISRQPEAHRTTRSHPPPPPPPPPLPSSLPPPELNPLNNPLNRPAAQFTPVRREYGLSVSESRPEYSRNPSQPPYQAVSYYETEPVRLWRKKSQSSFSPVARKAAKYALIILLDIVIAVTAVAIICFVSLLTGHLILRMAMSPSSTDPALVPSPYDAPIVPTIEAGVLGGAIIAVPFAVLIKILFPPRDDALISQSVAENEDFVYFDQAEGPLDARQIAANTALGGLRETSLTRMHCHRIAALVFCTCVGSAGGPIGVVALRSCYGGRSAWATVPNRLGHGHTVWLLDPLHTACAGALGGTIIGPGVLLLGWIFWKVWERLSSDDSFEVPRSYGIRGVERTQ